MQLRPTLIQISQENPFSNDKLNRSQSADVLTQLVSTIHEPFVLAIDSPWGTGKTTFIKMWMTHLKSKKFPCLYFNAWESDFTGDPLVSFIGEMREGLDVSSLKGEVATKAQDYFSKGKSLLGTLAKKSAPLAIKLLTQGALSIEGIEGTDIDNLAEALAKEKLERYEADKNTIQDFKAHLKDFANGLTCAGSGDYRPIIFFIDELDRCRPTYAIELLEKVKHLFNVDGIVFILAIDKVQIGHSIRSVYGSGMDVDGYLRRFIDLDYRLPEPSRSGFCESLAHRFSFIDLFKGRRDASDDLRMFIEAFAMLSEIFQLSLRSIEHSFSQVNFVLRTTPTGQLLLAPLVAFLIAFKAKDSNAYYDLASGRIDLETPIIFIKGLSGGQKYIDSYYGVELEAILELHRCSGYDTSMAFKKYRDLLTQHGENHPQGNRAKAILQALEWLARVNSPRALAQIIRRIELSEKFIDQKLT